MIQRWLFYAFFLSAISLPVSTINAALTTNSWKAAGNGKWETGANWSAGVPISTDTANLITNAATKTVTIDATTTNAANVSTLTISNLMISALSGQTNTLLLNSSGTNVPLHVLNTILLNSNAVVAVANAAIVANSAIVVGAPGANNHLSLAIGSLAVTNAASTGALDIRNGAFTFNGGMVTVDRLILTNGAAGSMTVSGGSLTGAGTLNSATTLVTNAQPFVVGDGTNRAVYHLLGGVHSFNDPLMIRSVSWLTGCGTISGAVVVDTNALVLADCGGTMTFTGAVTNNGAMQADNGTTLEAYGTVVNNGRITAIHGHTNFHGTFINNGTVATSVVIGNGPAAPDGSYLNAGNIADTLAFTNVKASSTNGIDIADAIDLANSPDFGPAFFDMNLTAGMINLTNNILFGYGRVYLYAPTVNLNGTVTATNGTLFGASRLLGTAMNVNVLSDSASLQQAVDLASNTAPVAIQTFPGQYQGDVLIEKTVTLSTTGGVVAVLSNLVVGDCAGGTNGAVTFSGGSLYVTNAAGTGALIIRKGSFTQTGGTLKVDTVVLTNSCGATFTRTGGTLIYSNAVLIANHDDDGDGIPNGYEQSHGLDPLDAADAAADNDGDGCSNLLEYQAGTDPNDPASSPFRIVDIHLEGDNVRVTWVPGPGSTNALQVAAGAADGGFRTNDFATIFSATNAVGPTTNYLDSGAATNFPSRYYRVRLVQ